MATFEIQKEDIGPKITVSYVTSSGSPIDLTGYSAITFIFLPPTDANRFTQDGTMVNATGGVVEYIFEDGDLNEIGTWKVQVIVDFGGGDKLHSTVGKFKVKDNI